MADPTAQQDAAAAGGEVSGDARAPELVPAEQVTAALGAAAEFKDRLLRTLAEMENLRKRTEREVADTRQFAIATFARDVLAVAELRDSTDTKMKSLVEGVELTERELMKVLERNGVRKFSPNGEKFDPNLHQAMYEVPDSDAAPGTVAQVIQAGYMLGDRVLRPAMVAVVKAAPKSPGSSANDNSALD
jgi:molecular chaperone GrpE